MSLIFQVYVFRLILPFSSVCQPRPLLATRTFDSKRYQLLKGELLRLPTQKLVENDTKSQVRGFTQALCISNFFLSLLRSD